MKSPAIVCFVVVAVFLISCSAATQVPTPNIDSTVNARVLATQLFLATIPATHTPIPPTSTPVPPSPIPFTSTPIPTSTNDPYCNTFWQNIRAVNLSIFDSPEQSQKILESELRRWTRAVNIPQGDQTLYLTYLSPQLIEAIVTHTATQKKLSQPEYESLLTDVERRLRQSNMMAFLLTIRTTSVGFLGHHRVVYLGPLEEFLVLYNQRQESFFPLKEYTQELVVNPNIRGESAQGYILFPRNAGGGCHPTVNVLGDHSFDVRLNHINVLSGFSQEDGFIYADHIDQVMWSFTLLPDIPLDEAMNIPLSSDAAQFDLQTLNDILSLALSVVEIWKAFP